MIDCSLIPSYECNLKCWFCMYDCGPNKKDVLDIKKAEYFISNVNFSMINQFGFYGGEISINLSLYQKFINLIPTNIPKFTITNGAWSRNPIDTENFINFITNNKIYTKISCTPEHKKYQNQEVLKKVCKENKNIKIKNNDDTKAKLLPMGRLSNQPFSCSFKCTRILPNQPFRIALEPDGSVIFQNCDGVYPKVGNYKSYLEEIEKNIHNLIERIGNLYLCLNVNCNSSCQICNGKRFSQLDNIYDEKGGIENV
jgi:hypothetical protein